MKKFAKGFVKSIKENGIITGAVASTGSLDRDEEILEPTGWNLDNFRKSPRLLWSHDPHLLPIGKVTDIKINEKGLIFDAEFAEKENPFAHQVANLVKNGFINSFSVGFKPLERDGNIFKKMELLEISLVNVPANPEARLSREYKSFNRMIKAMAKGVIPYSIHGDGPKADENSDWDVGKETAAADIKDLKVMCTWFDSEEPDNKTSYKLPHHTAQGHRVVWKGVAAAMAALLGARGGVNIPDDDKKGVYNHLAKHYDQFDKEIPDFKTADEIIRQYCHEPQKRIHYKPEETEQYIRIPVGNECEVTATINISEKEGIKALYCGKEKRIRTYLFLKSKGWTMDKAKKWVEEHHQRSGILFVVKKIKKILSEKEKILARNLIATLKQTLEQSETKGDKKVEPRNAKKEGTKKVLQALRLVDRATEYAIHEIKEKMNEKEK